MLIATPRTAWLPALAISLSTGIDVLWSVTIMGVCWAQTMALLGGGFVGVYILGMFTRRANGFGAVAGALGSAFAALSCIAFGYLFSFLRPAPQMPVGAAD